MLMSDMACVRQSSVLMTLRLSYLHSHFRENLKAAWMYGNSKKPAAVNNAVLNRPLWCQLHLLWSLVVDSNNLYTLQ